MRLSVFPVVEHLKKGEFLPDAVVCGRMVAPVWSDASWAGSSRDVELAEVQRKRWTGKGLNVDRLGQLLTNLEKSVSLIEGNHERHAIWAIECEESNKVEAKL